MSRIILAFFLLNLSSFSSSQLDTAGLFQGAFRWIESEPHLKQLAQVASEEAVDISVNSVHGEQILKGPLGFITASVKRAFGLIGRESEDHVVDKHHKRTNLIEVAKKLNLTTFLEKAKEAGIDDVLDHEGKFTVFAPTNEAFESMPSFCANLKLKDLMRFHVSKGAVPSSSFKNNLILRSLLTRRGTRINVYQNNTVLTANGRRINQTDFKASNGILHVIDNVMCAIYRGSAGFAINRCPKLTTLANAINITELYAPLEKMKRVTVFAPTDDAFAKIPAEILNDLLNNKTALSGVLLNHVVPDVWYSPGLEDGQSLMTLQGQNLTIGVNGNVTVDNATVIVADATVKNGVVHGIDTVLLPSSYQKPLVYDTEPVVLLV